MLDYPKDDPKTRRSKTRLPQRPLRLPEFASSGILIFLIFLLALGAQAQTCLSAPDMGAPTRAALEAAAQRYFEMSTHADTTGLKQNSIPMVSANFAAVDAAVKENQSALAGAHGTLRPTFLLNAEGPSPLPRAEFLCGVFGRTGQTPESAVFVLNNLPAGQYAIAILDVTGGSEPRTLTLVLQQVDKDWKLAGYYVRSPEAGGHDAAWFAQRARDFKAKSQIHNAWLYYREAIALSSPVDFMSTLTSDKLYDESEAVQPGDVPESGRSLDLTAAGKTWHWTEFFLRPVGDDFDVEIKYESPDISNTQSTFQTNLQLIKAVITKFPELRGAFAGVVARAVDPTGHDYGSMLPMKEIK